ncbi:plasmid stabilization protein [Xanthomonas hortorum pv. cynarae]|nr:plasmid stabilization protein [Xanthomonas hortorum]MCE4347679.1 plasmid stabilization protein [Xanthomonas hortorum pv. cynarae]
MRNIEVNEVTHEVLTMAILTVRNVPDEVHRALRLRAAEHGRSTEAEVREILESAVKSQKRIRMGDALAELGRRVRLTNDDFAVLDQVRDKVPAEPMRFE